MGRCLIIACLDGTVSHDATNQNDEFPLGATWRMSDNRHISAGNNLPRLAIVGCGAAARQFSLPVLTKYPNFADSIVLVDNDASRAGSIADELGIGYHCSDFRELPLEVEAAIITTPHHLHAEQAIHFLRQGKPVFVEKPLGMSASEAQQMLAAADAHGATLMVNQCRRLFPAYRRIQQLLAEQALGPILNIRITDGSAFEWGSVSDFYFRNAALAKGVLLDRGAHTVDLVCWWLPKFPQIVSSRHDAVEGAEARMSVEMSCGDAEIQLEFSRLHKLANRYSIECREGRISGRLFQACRFEITRYGKTESIQEGRPILYHQYAWQLLENFLAVVQGIADPLFTAADVSPSIELIDQSYQRAVPYQMPWYDSDPNIQLLRRQMPVGGK